MKLRMESLAFSYIFVREHVSAISHVPIRFLDSIICTNHKAPRLGSPFTHLQPVSTSCSEMVYLRMSSMPFTVASDMGTMCVQIVIMILMAATRINTISCLNE